jgi:subtilisin family serine protease
MRKVIGTLLCIASLTWVAPVTAQLVPQVQVPGVQLPQLPVDPALRGVTDSLRNLPSRAARAQRLFEQNRNDLERDPRGELVVRAEVVALDITEPALQRALDEDFRVKRAQDLPDLGVKVTILQTPEGWTARRGLKRLRKLDPAGTYDFNHVYFDSGAVLAAANTPAASAGETTAGSPRARIGVIDGGIDASHVALRESVVHRFGCGGEFVPSEHGTAVGSLLAGSAANFLGAAPRAELYAADVYCGKPTGGSVDSVAAAFGWLARERVAVVNVSLVGPRNVLLERVVKSLVDRGFLIVAAVGNDGAASPPLFPAAYEGVLGVTAVDGKHRVLLEACRGKHLDLAAPGTDFHAAAQGNLEGYVSVRGTSFAAPLVAGLLARDFQSPDAVARDRVVAALTARAEDLGPRGRDDIYGAGLVAAGLPDASVSAVGQQANK